MKVTNHNKGNYTHVTPADGGVMYGTIEMSMAEFTDALFYLDDEYKKAKREIDTYVRDGLSHVFNWTLPQWAKRRNESKDNYKDCKNRVCLGVTATELLFKKYNLPRYKKQNYVIVIKN